MTRWLIMDSGEFREWVEGYPLRTSKCAVPKDIGFYVYMWSEGQILPEIPYSPTPTGAAKFPPETKWLNATLVMMFLCLRVK